MFSDPLIKLIIETTVDLNEEQKKAVYQILMLQASEFMESRNYSKVKETAVKALLEFLKVAYNVSRVAINKGSLIISLNCKTLKGLDQLWYDYISGHLNEVAERYLVTDKMKRKLKLRKINLKTTIDEENYLNCRKVLVESSGEYQCLFLCCNILGRVGNDVCVYYRFDLGPWLSSIFIVPAVCDSNELQSWLPPKSA